MDDQKILQLLADLIDEISKKNSTNIPQQMQNAPESSDDDSALDTEKFVPPLQQHLEILKKMAGIPPKESEGSEETGDEVKVIASVQTPTSWY